MTSFIMIQLGSGPFQVDKAFAAAAAAARHCQWRGHAASGPTVARRPGRGSQSRVTVSGALLSAPAGRGYGGGKAAIAVIVALTVARRRGRHRAVTVTVGATQ